MDRQQTCKRCSIARVNALCSLYEKAHTEKDTTSLGQLKALVKVAHSRGFTDGYRILVPGFGKNRVRTVAWNISSFLFNDDMLRLGIPLNGLGRS